MNKEQFFTELNDILLELRDLKKKDRCFFENVIYAVHDLKSAVIYCEQHNIDPYYEKSLREIKNGYSIENNYVCFSPVGTAAEQAMETHKNMTNKKAKSLMRGKVKRLEVSLEKKEKQVELLTDKVEKLKAELEKEHEKLKKEMASKTALSVNIQQGKTFINDVDYASKNLEACTALVATSYLQFLHNNRAYENVFIHEDTDLTLEVQQHRKEMLSLSKLYSGKEIVAMLEKELGVKTTPNKILALFKKGLIVGEIKTYGLRTNRKRKRYSFSYESVRNYFEIEEKK